MRSSCEWLGSGRAARGRPGPPGAELPAGLRHAPPSTLPRPRARSPAQLCRATHNRRLARPPRAPALPPKRTRSSDQEFNPCGEPAPEEATFLSTTTTTDAGATLPADDLTAAVDGAVAEVVEGAAAEDAAADVAAAAAGQPTA